MGSIPVRSTKKRRMQFCIRRFLVFFLVNRPRFVNMACHILAEGLPLAGNGKFPYLILAREIIAILHSAFFGTLSRESPLGSSIWLAIFLPRDSRLREKANSLRIKVEAALFFTPLANRPSVLKISTVFSKNSGLFLRNKNFRKNFL